MASTHKARKPANQRRLPPGHGIGPVGIGTRRAHMKRPQRAAVADWAANAAGQAFWSANDAAQRGDTVAEQGHQNAAAGLRAEAEKLRDTLT